MDGDPASLSRVINLNKLVLIGGETVTMLRTVLPK